MLTEFGVYAAGVVTGSLGGSSTGASTSAALPLPPLLGSPHRVSVDNLVAYIPPELKNNYAINIGDRPYTLRLPLGYPLFEQGYDGALFDG